MRIYSPKPIRGHAADLLQSHGLATGQESACYHYDVDDEIGRELVASGKAQELVVPFGCVKEES